jgi:DNA-binding transcriptional LysR family regulator
MFVSLEQARALDALARFGTFAKAAEALRKRHTAVLYALRTMETELDLVLLDREGYRTRLTAAGERVLEQCRKMLAAEQGLEALVREIRGGWEPRLRIVFDGIFPAAPILRVVRRLAAAGAPTRVEVSAEFLSGVEQAFVRDDADVMISVLPPGSITLTSRALAPIRSLLVAHARHPLARARRKLDAKALSEHVLLIVRGADPRLELSTASLEPRSTVVLNDFATKKTALLDGMGFGWMPEYLVARDVKRGALRVLRWTGASIHAFKPRLYHREERALGRAGSMLLATLTAPSRVAAGGA